MAATLPATVLITDLPTGSAVTGAELFEAVQTSGGVGNSVQLTLSQMMATAVGALPSGGGTGQVLQSLGTGFAASWVNLSSLATASTGLAESGSTTIALSLASTAGLSVLGVAGTGSAVPAAIAGTGAQVFRINDGATAAGFGALNLGSSAAVTGVLPGANYSAVNLAATGAGGVQGQIGSTNIANAAVGTAQISTAGGAAGNVLAINTTGSTQWMGGMVLLNTLSPNNVATAGDTTSLTSTFRNYMVTFENVCPATQTTTFQLQIATTGTAFVSGSYVSQANVTVNATLVTDTSTSVILLSGTRSTTQLQTTTTYGLFGFVKFFNPAATAFRKQIVGDVSYLTPGASGTATAGQAQIAGYYDGANNAVTGIQFSFSSGNIQTGTIKIYGLA